MEYLPFAARLAIAAVLAFSGFSKLFDAWAVTAAAEGLGLGRTAARWAGRLLAPLEILIALLLLPGRTGYAAGAAALVVFTAFALLIAWNLAQGRRPPCACFGEAQAAPISGLTLARDLGLIALALVVVVPGPAASGPGLLAAATAAVTAIGTRATLAATLLLALLQTALLGLLLARQRAVALAARAAEASPRAHGADNAASGWPPGTLAPDFDLPSLDGERVTLRGLLDSGRGALLIFTDPGCRPCAALLPEIGGWQQRHGRSLAIAVVSQGTPAANRAKAGQHQLGLVLLQGEREVATAYRAEQTPSAVLVGREGRIASRVARGGSEIRELVAAAAASLAAEPPSSVFSPPPREEAGVPLGDPAPPFRLPALSGGEVDLFEFTGRVAILVFWSPSCPHCKRLLPTLLDWERAQTQDQASWIVLATGGRAANSLCGFRSPVLLDDGGLVSRAYGVHGTPSALLVDAESRVASNVAHGDAAVLALLRKADTLAGAARRLIAAG